MTALEEATARSLAAAETGDLAGLKEALSTRDTAIAALIDVAPSVELATSLGAAIQAGDEVFRALQAFKLRATFESRRLAQVEAGLVYGLGAGPEPTIDYRG